MIEARLNLNGVVLWTQVNITAYCPTSGVFVVRMVPSRIRGTVRRGELRDDNDNADILEAIARLTNVDYDQITNQEEKEQN